MEKLEIDNKKLIEAIENMKKEKTPESQSIMLGEMMRAKFLNPTTLKVEPDSNGKINIPEGTQISFFTITSTDNKRFALAFTDNDELNKWYEISIKNGVSPENVSRNSAVMQFMDYAGIVLGENSKLDGFVINPYTQNIVFNREQIASLRNQKINKEQYGITRNVIQNDEQIGLKKLDSEEYPTEMINKLIENMKENSNIKNASIAKMKKQEKESFLLIVDFDGELNSVLGNIAKIVKPFLKPPISLDIVALNSPLGKEASKYADMFYNKEGLQIFTKTENIEKSEVVRKAINYAQSFFENNYDGHDFYHTMRVYNLADKIAQEENADLEIVRLSALLHDVDDRKLVGKQKEPLENAKKFLKNNNISEENIEKICKIISEISYKGEDTKVPESLEGKIVQDADRIDAIGAIGIARAFMYTGSHKLPMHNPDCPYKENMNEEEYFSNDATGINHFHEKLLKLKDLMNTETAKKIAIKRHEYLENFLREFDNEWNGIN